MEADARRKVWTGGFRTIIHVELEPSTPKVPLLAGVMCVANKGRGSRLSERTTSLVDRGLREESARAEPKRPLSQVRCNRSTVLDAISGPDGLGSYVGAGLDSDMRPTFDGFDSRRTAELGSSLSWLSKTEARHSEDLRDIGVHRVRCPNKVEYSFQEVPPNSTSPSLQRRRTVRA